MGCEGLLVLQGSKITKGTLPNYLINVILTLRGEGVRAMTLILA